MVRVSSQGASSRMGCIGKIEGVKQKELRQINDDRGFVLHMLRQDSEGFLGFGECYFSVINYGKVKAWKYHYKQTQTLVVPTGAIRMVIYDDRALSHTKGVLQVLELGRPENYFRIQIPPNLWYGFTGLSKTPALIVNCVDKPHDPLESKVIAFDDTSIPYVWS